MWGLGCSRGMWWDEEMAQRSAVGVQCLRSCERWKKLESRLCLWSTCLVMLHSYRVMFRADLPLSGGGRLGWAQWTMDSGKWTVEYEPSHSTSARKHTQSIVSFPHPYSITHPLLPLLLSRLHLHPTTPLHRSHSHPNTTNNNPRYRTRPRNIQPRARPRTLNRRNPRSRQRKHQHGLPSITRRGNLRRRVVGVECLGGGGIGT